MPPRRCPARARFPDRIRNRSRPGPTPPSSPPSPPSPASPACPTCADRRLALDQAAAREHRLTLARGGTRRRAASAGGYRGSGYGKLSEEAILTAAACRLRLGMTWTLLGRLFGVRHTSISVPGNRAIPILEQHGITAGPGAPRINTPGKLLAHAAATGIAITIPDPPPKPAKHAGTGDSDTPETRSL